MRLRIAVNDANDLSVKHVEFTTSPVRIGRRPNENDIVLRHSFVSNPHALIEFDEEGVRVIDLGSRNGTFVGGKPVSKDRPTPLATWAQLDVGPFRLIVCAEREGDAEPQEPFPPTMALPLPVAVNPVDPVAPVPSPWSSLPRTDFLPSPMVARPPLALDARLKESGVLAPDRGTQAESMERTVPSASRGGAPLWDLVEESFEEATFLFRLWEDGLVSHARDLGRLEAFVEERLLGALEGIRLGGEVAWNRLLAPAMASNDRWALAIAAHIAMTGGPGVEPLLAMLGEAEGARLAALRRGLELVPFEVDISSVERRLAAGRSQQRAALVTLRAFRRRPPGPELADLIKDQEPTVRAAGLLAARYEPDGRALPIVELTLGAPDPLVDNAAVETGLCLGSRAAWQRCRELARTRTATSASPLLLVAFLGAGRDPDLVLAALGAENARTAAIKALGSVGTQQAAEACLEAMAVEKDARLAAESFSVITGLDLHAEDLIAPDPPEPDPLVPLENDDLDADLVPGPDDLLPPPDVEGVRRWWETNRARFANGGRYLLGKPISLSVLQEALVGTSMRRRRAVALELAIRTGGRYDVETNAFTSEQRRQMQGFAAVKDGQSQPASLAGLISRI